MTAQINVDYDTKTGRFVIHAPFFALGMMRNIPNRKFEKKLNNAWTAPALRANVQYLQEAVASNANFTDAARVKMQEVLSPTADVGRPFPKRYKFKTDPWEHQMGALNWSYGKKCGALFMDMRTGKTKTIIDLAMAMYGDALIDRLILVPLLTLRRNWRAEFGIHADLEQLDIYLLDTTKPKEFDKFNARKDGRLKVLLTGIESLSQGGAANYCLEFCCGPKTMAVIDESDSIKNGSSIRSQAMFSIREKAEYRLIMTGTPISAGPMDFYSQFEFLDPNIIGIGDFWSYRNRYAIMGGFEDKEIIGYQNMEELVELTKPFVHQVRYSDVFKSPPSIKEVRTVALTPEQKAIYKSIKKDGSIREDGNVKLVVQNVLEKMLRMQEACGGFWAERLETDEYAKTSIDQLKAPKFKYKHHKIKGKDPKIECLIDVVNREYAGEQGIIWAVRINELFLIQAALSEYGKVGMLHGDVEEGMRDQLDKDFRAGRIQWIVANPQTGARGYTFDAATFMVNYSSSFNMIHREQSLERATSGKKTKPVMIIDIVAENTVDEVVLEALSTKKNVSEFVRDAIAGHRRGIDELLVG